MRASPTRTFWITAAATFIAMLDVTIVNVAIPNMTTSFHGVSLSSLSWVINGYTIMFACLLAANGQFGELFGSRMVFLIGTALFTVASLAAAVAPSIEALILARLVQGAAAAAMLPSALGLLLTAYPPQRWTAAIGMWGAVASVASALGPLLGGTLVDAVDWRVIFLVNVPIGTLTVLCGLRMLAPSPERPTAHKPDLVGAALLAATVGLLVLGLVKSGDWGWTSTKVIGCFLATAVFALLFGLRLTRQESPLFEPSLLRARAFASANGSTLLFGFSFYSLLLCSVLFLTQVWHYSILQAGLAIFPGPLMSAVVSAPGGKLATRYGQRVGIIPGSFIYLAAMVWLATVPSSTPDFLGAWLPGYMVAGIGVGLVFPSQASAAAISVPPLRFTTGLAMNITARQLGAA